MEMLPFSPGFTGAFGGTDVVHPHEASISEISKLDFPVFLK
jgi:hypothetical protein